MDFLKRLTVQDYTKIIANVAVAVGAGFASGGPLGAAVAGVVALANIVQTLDANKPA